MNNDEDADEVAAIQKAVDKIAAQWPEVTEAFEGAAFAMNTLDIDVLGDLTHALETSVWVLFDHDSDSVYAGDSMEDIANEFPGMGSTPDPNDMDLFNHGRWMDWELTLGIKITGYHVEPEPTKVKTE